MELNKIYNENCLQGLSKLATHSVDCCITSPPYFGLRDYNTEPQIWKGEKILCENEQHDWQEKFYTLRENRNGITGTLGMSGDSIYISKAAREQKGKHGYRKMKTDFCSKCGAWQGHLGLEPTPELYIELTQIFNEVKRVLKPIGTLWLNIGDSYASGKSRYSTPAQTLEGGGQKEEKYGVLHNGGRTDFRNHPYIKDKDLIGIPFMLAFALRNSGWYLRQDIIWEKPNPMPESVTDRCTKSHEYIFLLTKSPKYFYDYQAILEPAAYDGRKDTFFKGSQKYLNGFAPEGTNEQTISKKGHERWSNKIYGRTETKDKETKMKGTGYGGDGSGLHGHSGYFDADGNERFNRTEDPARNKHSVWNVPTCPYKGAHFAVFPEKLIIDCIKAGTSEHGCCAKCGKPYERVLERKDKRHWTERQDYKRDGKYSFEYAETKNSNEVGRNDAPATFKPPEYNFLGWKPTCKCSAGVVPSIVLDPFMGAGTTAVVARKLNRNFIGFELNKTYIKLSETRLHNEIGIFL